MTNKSDKYGNIILTDNDIITLLNRGVDISEIQAENSKDIQLHNQWVKTFDNFIDTIEIYSKPNITIEEFDQKFQNDWLFSEEYQKLDIEHFLLSSCKTQDEIDRVELELKLFAERDMFMILRLLVYLVEFMRSNDIVWGVGRGSSCASYCLYLIGVHKVNALSFDININEFLK